MLPYFVIRKLDEIIFHKVVWIIRIIYALQIMNMIYINAFICLFRECFPFFVLMTHNFMCNNILLRSCFIALIYFSLYYFFINNKTTCFHVIAQQNILKNIKKLSKNNFIPQKWTYVKIKIGDKIQPGLCHKILIL